LFDKQIIIGPFVVKGRAGGLREPHVVNGYPWAGSYFFALFISGTKGRIRIIGSPGLVEEAPALFLLAIARFGEALLAGFC